jgi:peroxiredoxin
MQPHLVRWQDTYAAQGLTVLYVANGQRVDAASMQARIRAERLAFPVLHDAQGASTAAYGVRAFPTAYILDRTGRVVWEGVPVFNPQATERAIVAALR